MNKHGSSLYKDYLKSLESDKLAYEQLEVPGKSKNLVYCCVFYNRDYFKLLRLLLLSIQRYSKIDNFDFLILTHEKYVPTVHEMCLHLRMYCKIHTFPFTTIFQAACARLHIFDVPDVNSYSKILYLDTDIIVKGDLNVLLDMELEDVVYGLESGTISSPSFGNQFFDFSAISDKTTGINSGTLLFNKCDTVKNAFSRIRDHVQKFTAQGHRVPYCMDQPFINYHLIKDRLYNNTALKPYISLYEDADSVDNYETSIVCHFSFPIGNFAHKYTRMMKFFTELLVEVADVWYAPDILGKTYTWDKGTITFSEGSVNTTWGAGGWNVVGKGCVKVYWRNHYHALRFNEDYSKFSSIRTWPLDCDVVHGSLVTV